MDRITAKVWDWQQGKASLGIIPSDLESLVQESFDTTHLLIASINDTFQCQDLEWVCFEKKVIEDFISGPTPKDRDQWNYLGERLKTLLPWSVRR